jgi:hypothetical protein
MIISTYKLIPAGIAGDPIAVLHIETGNIIPMSQGNTHYQEYLAWLAEGNEPLPAGDD